jgi:hypothetical protein
MRCFAPYYVRPSSKCARAARENTTFIRAFREYRNDLFISGNFSTSDSGDRLVEDCSSAGVAQ